ncbi:inorganic diphosphatase [Fastidiosibacter lacustris]|uniref:inorganic diphosphatase n=1 Tax=Fastidiosibacter lacustris TaxID=2056695 RepID=UPI000E34EA55|nr:inorganic diphosphatase [Fastidiosibacter lacustris]
MLANIKVGKDAPNDINVVIEIPAYNEPVKYEFDKDANMLIVDRFMSTTMQYPCNYGFVPNTLSEDGDPVDVLVVAPVALRPGVIINCRPVGVLKMADESGVDAKIIAVPSSKLTKIYDDVREVTDLSKLLLDQIKHFFEHYKDLEPNKWVKVDGFEGVDSAKADIKASIKRYKKD